MIDKMLRQLVSRDEQDALEHFERDLWHREFQYRMARQNGLALASWQAAIVAIAVMGSAGVGVAAAASASPSPMPHFLSAGEEMLPSTLLFGHDR
jgi:hypothetical protein